MFFRDPPDAPDRKHAPERIYAPDPDAPDLAAPVACFGPANPAGGARGAAEAAAYLWSRAAWTFHLIVQGFDEPLAMARRGVYPHYRRVLLTLWLGCLEQLVRRILLFAAAHLDLGEAAAATAPSSPPSSPPARPVRPVRQARRDKPLTPASLRIFAAARSPGLSGSKSPQLGLGSTASSPEPLADVLAAPSPGLGVGPSPSLHVWRASAADGAGIETFDHTPVSVLRCAGRLETLRRIIQNPHPAIVRLARLCARHRALERARLAASPAQGGWPAFSAVPRPPPYTLTEPFQSAAHRSVAPGMRFLVPHLAAALDRLLEPG